MTIVAILLFSVVFAVSIWTMIDTVSSRSRYIRALLNGSAFGAPQRVPVAALRTVRRVETVRYQQPLRRAAA